VQALDCPHKLLGKASAPHRFDLVTMCGTDGLKCLPWPVEQPHLGSYAPERYCQQTGHGQLGSWPILPPTDSAVKLLASKFLHVNCMYVLSISFAGLSYVPKIWNSIEFFCCCLIWLTQAATHMQADAGWHITRCIELNKFGPWCSFSCASSPRMIGAKKGKVQMTTYSQMTWCYMQILRSKLTTPSYMHLYLKVELYLYAFNCCNNWPKNSWIIDVSNHPSYNSPE
jgi:hypothetical protein